MKKKYRLFIYLFLMFFCVGIGGVKADETFYPTFHCTIPDSDDIVIANCNMTISDQKIKDKNGILSDCHGTRNNLQNQEVYTISFDNAFEVPEWSKCYKLTYTCECKEDSLGKGCAIKDIKFNKSDADANDYDHFRGINTVCPKSDLGVVKNKDMIDHLYIDDSVKEANDGNLTCTDVLSDEIVKIISDFIRLISIVGVVLLVFLMIFDFVKAVVSSEEGAVMKAFKGARIRIIATILLFLLPVIVNFIAGVFNNLHFVKSYDNNGKAKSEIKFGDVSECINTEKDTKK